MRLPDYKGNFPVSVTNLRKPIRPSHVYSNARLDGKPALKLEEVAYTVYYPTTKNKSFGSESVYWLPRPLDVATAGWAKFAGRSYWLLWPFVHFFARFIRLPAQANSPLRPAGTSSASNNSTSSSETLGSNKKWPLVIFSHGLAGGRYTYSWEQQPSGKLPIRVDQLKFRIREIYEAFESLKEVVNGNRGSTVSMDSFDQWDSFKGQVDYSKLILAGHSFGGATALSLLSSPPPEGHVQLPIEKAILLDPWMEPLPLPGNLPIAYDSRPPLLVMNSEGFTLWKDHFTMLEELVADWRQSGEDSAALVTIARSKHHFYSDFGLFVPFGSAKTIGTSVLNSAHQLSMACIRNELSAELKGKRRMELEPVPGKNKWGENKRQLVGEPGEIIIH